MGSSISIEDKYVERALLVGVEKREDTSWSVQESVEELSRLAGTAGVEVTDHFLCRQDTIHPGHYIGRGKAETIAEQVKEQELNTVIFDDDLSPAQGRNLEQIIGVRVVDRSQLILDIFAQHAQTREGRLQIELAQLQYLFPRLRRMWTHLERQKGGIGLRGPGEKQLEVDRRKIEERLQKLRKELEEVRRHRRELRRGRRRHGWALVSLVGYTNAGKSTLLNALTGANVKAYNQLFATLDPTTRQVKLPNQAPVLLTDTVGFIKKLPHHLVESFRATLEEVVRADLLLHVIDASHPHVDDQVAAVYDVLKDLDVLDKPVIAVLNKVDNPDVRQQAKRLARQFDRVCMTSAIKGEGLEELKALLADGLKDMMHEAEWKVPQRLGKFLAMLRKNGRILEETYEDDYALVKAMVPEKMLSQHREYRTDLKDEEKW